MDREHYVTCLRKEVLYWMGDREDYVTCLRKEVLYWMGDGEDYVTCLWEAERTMLPF